ncbi:MAG TPA: dihydrofolate reductase family protein [Ferruginibacter sp.]|nr:dihydrofolate reductase family protein [Ferruginibacter sp.]
MRKIVVLSMISLDGVIQAPGGPKEDRSGGFKYGGWVAPYSDKTYRSELQKELQPSTYLLGRKTFANWAAYWPHHGDFWPGINEGTKFVFTKKIKATNKLVTGWKNVVLIKTLADIRKIKTIPVTKKDLKNTDIQVWGSSELVQLLLKHDLVDELRLKIHPLTLGKGKKLFDKGTLAAGFKLVSHVVTSSGVIIAHYKRAGKVVTAAAGVK